MWWTACCSTEGGALRCSLASEIARGTTKSRYASRNVATADGATHYYRDCSFTHTPYYAAKTCMHA